MADMSSLAESIRCNHSVASMENVLLKRPLLFLQCNHHASAQVSHILLSFFRTLCGIYIVEFEIKFWYYWPT